MYVKENGTIDSRNKEVISYSNDKLVNKNAQSQFFSYLAKADELPKTQGNTEYNSPIKKIPQAKRVSLRSGDTGPINQMMSFTSAPGDISQNRSVKKDENFN